MKKYLLTILLLFIATPSFASNTTGHAWSESVGWFDFGNAIVLDTELTGYAYNDNIGWLSLNCSNTSSCNDVNYKVTNSNGDLGGHAWSESVGWLDFSNVELTEEGNNSIVSGNIYNDNIGWIIFQDSETDWSTSNTQTNTSDGGGNTYKKKPKTTKPTEGPKDTKPKTEPKTNIPNIILINNKTSDIKVFNRDLDFGIKGEDVRELQEVLNKTGYIINSISGGPGSLGNETTYFGEKTRQSLAKYQKDNGISPALGYFGPKTKAFMKMKGLIK
jgi:hypothetical protein